jgi:hypothetical protein
MKREAVQRVVEAARDVGVGDARAALAALETSHANAVAKWITAGAVGLRPEMDSKEHAKRSVKLAELVATEAGYDAAREQLGAEVLSLAEELRAAETREAAARAAVMTECADAELAEFHSAADAALAAAVRVAGLRGALIANRGRSSANGDASRRFCERTAITPNANPSARGGLLAFAYNTMDTDVRREIARLHAAWASLEDLLSLNPAATLENALVPSDVSEAA